jgi:hypothetical protein
MILQWPVDGTTPAKEELMLCIKKLKEFESVNTHSIKEATLYSIQQPTALFFNKKEPLSEIMY